MEIKADRNTKVDSLIKNSYLLFQKGEFKEAILYLEEALSIDFDDQEVLFALKCANFWEGAILKYRVEKGLESIGDFLLNQWRNFVLFLNRVDDNFDDCLYPIRQYVFGTALDFFKKEIELRGKHDSQLLFSVGRCYKGIGNYEQALRYFETSSHQKDEDPEILAELADCYAFIGETKASKIFFREAFFIDPQNIDIRMLESLLIVRLTNRIKDLGIKSPELEEWIPVYGVLWGVFNVKRELKPLEIGRLKQAIFNMESEIEQGKEPDFFVIPRLINRYFRLIDHLVSTKENHEKVNDVLKKIKKIDINLYEEYIH